MLPGMGAGFRPPEHRFAGLNAMFHTPRKIAFQRFSGECPLSTQN